MNGVLTMIKEIFQGAVIAFSLYSRIPVPQVQWRQENMKYTLAFLPLLGIVAGSLIWLWTWLVTQTGLSQTFFAAVAACIPLLVTGGFHLDGFCDTVDALSSHQDCAGKQRILKDPHLGTFAVVGCCVYLLLTFGLWQQIAVWGRFNGFFAAAGYVCARAFGGLLLIQLPKARTDGLGAAFAHQEHKGGISGVLLLWLVAGLAVMYGTFWPGAVAYSLLLLGFFGYCCRMVRQEFGGMSGDLAGFMIESMELIALVAFVVGVVIAG